MSHEYLSSAQTDHIPALMLEQSCQAVVLYATFGAVCRNNSVGIFLSINCVQVLILHGHMLNYAEVRKLAQIHRKYDIFLQVLVYSEDDQLLSVIVVHGYTVDEGYSAVFFVLICRRIHLSLEHDTLTVFSGEPIGIVDGLPPAEGVGGHDGRNDIDRSEERRVGKECWC